MTYFDGVQWIMARRVPDCRVWLPQWKAPLYALNFARSGRVQWAAGRRRAVVLQAPVAWWTWPDQEFSYGRVNGESWDHAYVTFSGPRVKVWRDQGLFSTKPERGFAAIQDAETFSSRMDSLVGLVLGGATRNDWMTSQLESLLVLCLEAKPTPASDIHDDRIKKAMNGNSLAHFRSF